MVTLRSAFRRWRRLDLEAERDLDRWIEDALREDALAQPSNDAWERLRLAITERQSRSHAMWVLEQPIHDPRVTSPTGVSGGRKSRMVPLHDTRVPYHQWQVRESMWGTMLPTFSALVNW